ncbi:MAG: ABC transporter substrate-binding protein [Balneolaceae bacterium]
MEQGPRAANDSGESAPEETTADDNGFQQLTIGLVDPVTNFDPLFAENLSTMRVLSLIYDGLYTLDNRGEPKPAIAESVSVSGDGRTYTFTLRDNLFFHDSPVFTTGLGRRVTAADVKWAFERTARLDVPPHAAHLLMNVVGFEGFYQEQRTIYDPQSRAYTGVPGIRAVNANTLEITLVEEDSEFLKRLASPWLYIYPREALAAERNPLRTHPVGTAAYTFTRKEDSGTIILAKDPTRNAPNRLTQPTINRLNLVHYERESDLFQRFARNEIDWIPELGPETAQLIASEQLTLNPSYEGTYELMRHPGQYRVLLFATNPAAEANLEALSVLLQDLSAETFNMRGRAEISLPSPQNGSAANPDSVYYAPFTTTHATRVLLTAIQNRHLLPESALRLVDTRAPINRTSILHRGTDSFHHSLTSHRSDYWLRFHAPILSLHHPGVQGIRSAGAPWLIHVETVTNPSDTQGAL